MVMGMACLSYAWKEWNLRHFYACMLGGVLFSASWDIWANVTEQWLYRVDPSLSEFQRMMFNKHGKQYSSAFMDYSWNWIRIGNVWMPLEVMPYYYINGIVCFYGVLTALKKMFGRNPK